MEKSKNPYRPGAGTKPLVLSGRDEVISSARALFASVRGGAPQRSMMLYGLRGVGKTVLLNTFEELSQKDDYLVEHLEMSDNDDFRRVIAKSTRKLLLQVSPAQNLKDKARRALGVLRAFTMTMPDGPEFKIDVDAVVGTGDSGDLDTDLVDLMVALGVAAKESGKYLCFLIDEVQYLNEQAFSGLIAASHRISQKALPVVFLCAGLPQIAALAGTARSYAERLFAFVEIGRLSQDAGREALVEPAKLADVTFDEDAIARVLEQTEGYPYFLQEFGKHIWDHAPTSPVTLDDVVAGCELATASLDGSFFKVRIDRATDAEQKFMRAMALLGTGSYKMGDVARKRRVKVQSLGPVRATLIGKGFVFSPSHGYIEFTVPQFDRFVRRHFAVAEA